MALAISKKSIWVKILVMLCALALLAVFALPPRAHAVVALTGAAAFTAAMLLWLGFSASTGASLAEVAQYIADGFSQSVKDLLDQGTQIVNGQFQIDPATVQDSRFYSIVEDIQSQVADLEVTIPVGGFDVPAQPQWSFPAFQCVTPSFLCSKTDTYPFSVVYGEDIVGVWVSYNGTSTASSATRVAVVASPNSGCIVHSSFNGVNTTLSSTYYYQGQTVYYSTLVISYQPNTPECSPFVNLPHSWANQIAWAMIFGGTDFSAGGTVPMLDVGSITAQALIEAMINTANNNTPISVPLNAVPDLSATINGSDVPLTGTQEDAVIPSSFAPSLDTPLDIHNSNIFSRIWEWLQNFWTELTSTITGAISGIAEGVSSIVEAIEGIFEAIANPFAEFFTELLPSFWTTLVGTINGTILNFASIWHYVVSWIGSISSGFSLIRSVWSGLPYAMYVPIYASLVIVLVFFVFKRIFF